MPNLEVASADLEIEDVASRSASAGGSLWFHSVNLPPVTAAFREAVYLDQQNSWTPTSLPASSKRGAQTSIKSFFTPPSLDAMAKRTRQSTFKCNADAACGLSFASKPGLNQHILDEHTLLDPSSPLVSAIDDQEVIDNESSDFQMEDQSEEASQSDSYNDSRPSTSPPASDTATSLDDEDDSPRPLKKAKAFASSSNSAADTSSDSIVVNGLSATTQKKAVRKPVKVQEEDKFIFRLGYNEGLPPISKNADIFEDMINKAMTLGLSDVIQHFKGGVVKIGTMCSGTESPILAMSCFTEILATMGHDLDIEHIFSAEIVPWKQAYIERNFPSTTIFRDVVEMGREEKQAHTAYGALRDLPGEIDILIAGSSCVDFSNLNGRKKTVKDGGESGDTFLGIMGYAKRFKPKIIILENVMGSVAQWAELGNYMYNSGYANRKVNADTKAYYLPQTRSRGYMVAVLDPTIRLDTTVLDQSLADDDSQVSDTESDDVDEESFASREQWQGRLPKSRGGHKGKGKGKKQVRVKKPVVLDGNHPNDRKPWSKARRIAEKWAELMEKFQRPVSSPYSDFLLEDDDERVVEGRKEVERLSTQRTTEPDWTRNQARHRVERTKYRWGHDHFHTQWDERGVFKGPDFLWRTWASRQPQRVWDTIDAAFLRAVTRGFDQTFKNRHLDLSQAIDRETDVKGSGLLGCLTPKGLPFTTFRGGLVLGIECLALQGIPIDRLSLLRESQSNLQDLAGNAMSSPVVGAAILSVLLSALDVLPKSFRDQGSQALKALQAASHDCTVGTENTLVRADRNAEAQVTSKSDLLAKLSKGVRLCECESAKSVATAAIQECSLCKHTSCISCGVEQRHAYRVVNPARMSPAMVAECFKNALPSKLALAAVDIDILDRLQAEVKLQILSEMPKSEAVFRSNDPDVEQNGNNLCNVWRSTVERALIAELRFQSVKRSRGWTATYRGDHARLVLVIAPGQLEWLLYAEVDAERAGNDPVRRILSDPIARMLPEEDNILSGVWQVWNPIKRASKVEIKPAGKFVQSFRHQIGLIDHVDTYNRESYILSSQDDISHLNTNILGTYKLLPCHNKVAERSLHVKEDTFDSETPLYLFLDPTAFGEPTADNFVFSHNINRLGHHQNRSTVARVAHTWREPVFERILDEEHAGHYLYKLRNTKDAACRDPDTPPTIVSIEVDGIWTDFPSGRLVVPSDDTIVYQPGSDFRIRSGSGSCSVAQLVVHCHGKLPNQERSPWKKGRALVVKDVEQQDFFGEFAWLLEKNVRFNDLQDWQAMQVADTDPQHCSICAPEAPPIKWTMSDNKGSLKPFEDARLAGPFEAAIKNRPQPFIVKVEVSDVGVVDVKIAFNPETLIHRALAIMTGPLPGTKLDWRLVTGYIASPAPELPSFLLCDNKADVAASQPSDFKFKDCLRPEQLRSLGWQLKQENDPPAFWEEEIAEAYMPQYQMRGEGRITRSIKVRGGVLAHEVGYGKTVTTLALISAQRLQDAQKAQEPVMGRVPTKATLILVPNQLRMQWASEAHKFLKPGYNVLQIATVRDLAKLTISQVRNADIIIANWKLFEGEQYMFLVAQFSGLVELPSNAKTRAQNVWYDAARKKIAENVELLKQGGHGLHAKIKQDYDEQVEIAAQEETFIPSKRLTGQNYQNHKAAMTTLKTVKMVGKDSLTKTVPRLDPFELSRLARSKSGIAWEGCKYPLLELFQFSRVVVDEFVYTKGREIAIIANLSARARWVLSATPPMRDFSDIKSMATMIGINLGIDYASPEALDADNVKAIEAEQTDAETFRSRANKPPSAHWHEHRHAHAQKFLDLFARQDKADYLEIPGTEHIITVELPAAERAIYTELYKNTAGAKTIMHKKRKADNDEDEMRAEDFIADCKGFEEAWVRCAAHFSLAGGDVSAGQTLTSYVISNRHDGYNDLRRSFRKTIRLAEWLSRNNDGETCVQYTSFKQHVLDNRWGDPDVQVDLLQMIEHAENSYHFKDMHKLFQEPEDFIAAMKKIDADVKASGVKISNKEKNKDLLSKVMLQSIGKPRDEQIRKFTKELSQYASRMVASKRGIRLFEVVQDIEQDASMSVLRGPRLACAACGASDLLVGDVSVLAECGHVSCKNCLPTLAGACGAGGCNALFGDHEIFPATAFAIVQDKKRPKRFGTKIERLVELMKAIPADEQVLLFIQFDHLRNIVQKAFDESGITYAELKTDGKAAQTLIDFQEANVEDQDKVLFLDIGGASAAGANLTRANHVVFFHPYLASSNQEYHAAMTQSRGRARRYGQKRHVHIYQFLTLHTYDIDAIQGPSGKIFKEDPNPVMPEIKPYESWKPASYALFDPLSPFEVGLLGNPAPVHPADEDVSA